MLKRIKIIKQNLPKYKIKQLQHKLPKRIEGKRTKLLSKPNRRIRLRKRVRMRIGADWDILK